jgi:replicative DNA helicase
VSAKISGDLVAVSREQQDHLPISEVGEKGLLSSLIQNPRIYLENEGIIRDYLFEFPANRIIFFVLIELAPHFEEIDFKTLIGAFHQSQLDLIGGRDYLNEVFSFASTPKGWRWYHNQCFDAHRMRRARGSARAILELEDLDQAIEIARLALQDIADINLRPSVPFKEHLLQTLEWLEKQAATPPQSVVRFGIDSLDDALLPIEPGDQIVICADTGRGKSALAAQAVLSTAGRSFAVFSLEMPARSLVARMLANESRVPFSDLRRGRLRDRDYPLVTGAVSRLGSRSIWIEDQHPISANTIAAKCRTFKRTGLDCIVVDYLQLVAPAAPNKRDTREREVAEMSRSLKSLALELDIVVIALSQLNEGGQLRESRAIGQDADIVLGIHQEDEGLSIQVRKHRNGPRRSVPVMFDGSTMRFFEANKTISEPPRLPYTEEAA